METATTGWPRCALAPGVLVAVLLLGACRASLPAPVEGAPTSPGPEEAGPVPLAAPGDGAAPGNADGPGGFVPRGSARNFYAGAGGRLWYYMNNYYWAPASAPLDDLWIKAVVVETFTDLRRWPDGLEVPPPAPKITNEYWRVGPGRRSVRLDNHKDYCLLSDRYTAGAITVQVTLTLGHLRVRDDHERWGGPKEAYVLESRNYADRDGIGADHAHFEPLRGEPVTVWGYRVPWSVHPQRLTRSSWQDLELPDWSLLERRAPPNAPARPVTPDTGPSDASSRPGG